MGGDYPAAAAESNPSSVAEALAADERDIFATLNIYLKELFNHRVAESPSYKAHRAVS